MQKRAEWRRAAQEAEGKLAARKPHPLWKRLVARVGGGSVVGGNALAHGEGLEPEARRLVGGAVLRSGLPEVDKDADVIKAVSTAVRLGLELQEAGRAATAKFENRVREETARLQKVRWHATQWREAVLRGGPRRAALLRERLVCIAAVSSPMHASCARLA